MPTPEYTPGGTRPGGGPRPGEDRWLRCVYLDCTVHVKAGDEATMRKHQETAHGAFKGVIIVRMREEE